VFSDLKRKTLCGMKLNKACYKKKCLPKFFELRIYISLRAGVFNIHEQQVRTRVTLVLSLGTVTLAKDFYGNHIESNITSGLVARSSDRSNDSLV